MPGKTVSRRRTWWLLLRGLYLDSVYFLLSPERSSQVVWSELQMRWAIAYLAGVVVIAYGQSLALMLRASQRSARGQRVRGEPGAGGHGQSRLQRFHALEQAARPVAPSGD